MSRPFDVHQRHFTVPLDHADPRGEQLRLSARELVRTDDRDRPWLLFLNGGPGMPAPRVPKASGWLDRALDDFRVLLVDQRGTGASDRVDGGTIAARGDAAAQASYLSLFRADSIVQDCEHIRAEMIGPDGTWSVLGQSFGGFCTTTYLARAPDHLDRALIVGGLPPLTARPDEVWRGLYHRLDERNTRYFARFPEDRELLVRIRRHLLGGDVRLPGGDGLPVERLQFCGYLLGQTDGPDILHRLLAGAFRPGTDELSPRFLRAVEEITAITTGPLFAFILEAVYCQEVASRWSAERLLFEFPQFSTDADTLNFRGEMVYPSMFDDHHNLSAGRAGAHALAEKSDWPLLYDVEALQRNEVPAAALIYTDDLYVAPEPSLATAHTIRGLHPWVDSARQHDAIHVDGAAIFEELLRLTS